MNERRREFIKTFAVQVKGLMDKKFNKENEEMKPTLGELADGYRSFIADLGEGFLEVLEKYNECLQIAKKSKLIEDIQLRARIKDFSSSLSNTEEKLLDDVFGMELVTGKDIDTLIKMRRTRLKTRRNRRTRKERIRKSRITKGNIDFI